MPNLKCSVKNCYYNKEQKCCLDKIHVEGDDATIVDATYCGSFKEEADGSSASSCHCEGSPEKNVQVKCEARNCTFNDNEKCHAKAIGIEGSGARHESQTACGSFECSCD